MKIRKEIDFPASIFPISPTELHPHFLIFRMEEKNLADLFTKGTNNRKPDSHHYFSSTESASIGDISMTTIHFLKDEERFFMIKV